MAWIAVSFDLDASLAAAASEALLERGALSVDVSDAEAGTALERPLFGEPGGEASGIWPRTRISALFNARGPAESAVGDALAAVGLSRCPALTVSSIGEQDWVRATQHQFGPIQVAPGFWIVPTWCNPPDPAGINLRLDPGLAFGTGSHPTTMQCLRWLRAHLAVGDSVLDYGCGSGILAIAARRLGAATVVGTDIDAAALQASRYNAHRNGAEVHVVAPEDVPIGPYDAVFANILSTPLIVLAPLLTGYVRPGRSLVLAGVLDSQADAVAAAYRPGFEAQVVSSEDGWTCLAGTRIRHPP